MLWKRKLSFFFSLAQGWSTCTLLGSCTGTSNLETCWSTATACWRWTNMSACFSNSWSQICLSCRLLPCSQALNQHAALFLGRFVISAWRGWRSQTRHVTWPRRWWHSTTGHQKCWWAAGTMARPLMCGQWAASSQSCWADASSSRLRAPFSRWEQGNEINE